MRRAQVEKTRKLQRRRLRAGRLLVRGVAQAEVARRVGVSRTTVSAWNRQLEAHGLEGLRARPRGRPSGLTDRQRGELLEALLAGALAEGFPTDLWTLRRVGQLIDRRFGRRYSESQVWRILMALGFSCQRPSGRALERDESAIRKWKRQRWPALKLCRPGGTKRLLCGPQERPEGKQGRVPGPEGSTARPLRRTGPGSL